MDERQIKAIIARHEQWLREDGGEQADLRRANLRGANLSGAALRDANLRWANLRWADLRDADLSGADLRGANLCDADLSGADLRGANLCDADLCDADLSGANLCDANLRYANLRGANLDYSCWPLWCGSLDVKVDKRIACQLAYHFCRLACDDPDYLAARNAIIGFANQFHRVKECGQLVEVTANE